jgi:malate dehydrogenase
MSRPIRVAISGAGGQIGYALVFRIAAGGLFGAEQTVSLSLLESPIHFGLIQSITMELKDCAFPLLNDVSIHIDPYEAFADADWVVLLGGRPRKAEGERRIDLIRDNGPIFVAHGRAINEASPEARVLVVANPCNTNCLVARSVATNVPAEHWFALTRLDRMRATSLLAEKAGVPVAQVTRMTIWGNHSEQVFPDFHNAWIGTRPAPEVVTDREWVRNVFEPTVAQRGLEIIRLRGASPAASAAQAILGTIRSLTTPTPFDRRFGAAVVSDGSYGVPHGLIFGFPLVSEDGHTWKIVQGLYLDSYAQDRIAQNIAELEHEAAACTDMLGSLA